MNKKLQEIREWNETQKNTVKKLEDTGLNISVETSIYDHIDYLLQQIEIKDKALEFYEDETNYTTEILVPGEEYSFLLILDDKGKVARAALKGEDTQ